MVLLTPSSQDSSQQLPPANSEETYVFLWCYYIAYAPPRLFPWGLAEGNVPPSALNRLQASPRAAPLCPYLHNASSCDKVGLHFGSVLGLQFLVSFSSYL